MILEMQGNVAKKARRMVIERTLGGRATFKVVHDCLKLHLPMSYISTTLLTRGYFLVLFKNEEGAIATRKLTTIEWSGLNLSFSRFSPDFDTSAQGAEALLTHAIKVQFPDLHEQFKNATALTIMASKLGEVLDIEAADSYIKRPAGPMVTVEVKDITKLVRIPSMAKGATTTNTIRQKILYSSLPNQCRKCRKFGHHARACNILKTSPREESTHYKPPPSESTREVLGTHVGARGTAWAIKLNPPTRAPSDTDTKKGGGPRAVTQASTAPPRPPTQSASQASPQTASLGHDLSQRRPTSNDIRD